MEDEERQRLIQKLDADLEAFIQEKAKKKQDADSLSEETVEETDIDALAEELKQHPAFMTEFDPSKPMSPAMEALQQLKYESESPDSNAESYKVDGNQNFKLKKYRWAIDNYTAGIKCKPQSRELNAILYSNRAAANFHLGNFRSSFNDCIASRKFKADHLKAIVRGIQCCLQRQHYDDALKWCDDALLISPKNETVLEYRTKADKLKRQKERDTRKEKLKERKKQVAEHKLLQAIKDRGIRLESGSMEGKSKACSAEDLLETHHPSAAKVRLDDEGKLHWPVMFLYPEYGQTDLIEAFSEDVSFQNHLDAMFRSEAESPPWDRDSKYIPDKLQIFYEERDAERIHEVKPTSTLGDVLKNKRYTVYGGMPAFYVLPRDTEFTKSILAKYKT